MKTTLREIRKHEPCADGWKKLIKVLGTSDPDTEITILEILESNGVKDAFWALRTQKYEEYCLILADVAESVVRLTDDKRVSDCIQAIRDYNAGKINRGALSTARAAAGAAGAAEAAWAARAAARAAAWAAWAAEAAWAARAAARAAAWAAGAAGAAEAAWAAGAAAGAAAWENNEAILRRYL
jgi:hypothetical protein